LNIDEYKRKALELTQTLACAWQDFDETNEAYKLMDDSFVNLINFMCLTKIDGKSND
jgi:hypothetical protein